MKWSMTGLATAVLLVALAGCVGEPVSPANDNAELDLLVQRTFDLKDRVAAAGRMTPELRLALTVLTTDVETWQGRTGRKDISVSHSAPAGGNGIAEAPRWSSS